MKATKSLLIVASLLASPAFAEEDLCAVNLQKLDDQSLGVTLGDPLQQQIETLREAAIQAQFDSDIDSCVTQSGKALQMLESSNKGPDGGGD